MLTRRVRVDMPSTSANIDVTWASVAAFKIILAVKRFQQSTDYRIAAGPD